MLAGDELVGGRHQREGFGALEAADGVEGGGFHVDDEHAGGCVLLSGRVVGFIEDIRAEDLPDGEIDPGGGGDPLCGRQQCRRRPQWRRRPQDRGDVAVGHGLVGGDDRPQRQIGLVDAARPDANDPRHPIEADQLGDVDRGRRHTHTGRHDRDGRAVVGTGEAGHSAHVGDQLGAHEEPFGDVGGPLRIAGHQDGVGEGSVGR